MYEIHVTINPVPDEQLATVKDIAECSNFKLAELLMKRSVQGTIERSPYDTFMTGHTKDYAVAEAMTKLVCNRLTSMGFQVWRYKIEHVILDSKYQPDPLGLLK